MVLQKKTLPQLQDLIAWADGHHVDFIIASHLFSYDGSLTDQSLFNPNSCEATRLFAKWSAEAKAQGVNLEQLSAAQLKFSKSPSDTLLVRLGDAMRQEAKEKNIAYHFANLVAQSSRDMGGIETYFHKAQWSASKRGIDLFLPPLYAYVNGQRRCPFINDEAVFIDKNGKVMPCHFLWHTCPSRVNHGAVQVEMRVLGSVKEESLEMIWQKEASVAFRVEARKLDYAPCWSCASAPCADLVNSNLLVQVSRYAAENPHS